MNENLDTLIKLIETIESDLKKVKALATKLQGGKKSTKPTFDATSSASSLIKEGDRSSADDNDENIKVVEGIFDGYFMIGTDGKKYPVPMNYSSKSKLIQGDHLKLRIMSDGALKYKVVKPADRKFVKATLVKHDDGRFQAIDETKKLYNLNQAAVTFFSGQAGDKLSLIVPLDTNADYAAIEVVVK